MDDPIWLTTYALFPRHAISCTTLLEIRCQGLIKDGRDMLPWHQAAPNSDLHWHHGRRGTLQSGFHLL
jgi:hypothetical protein